VYDDSTEPEPEPSIPMFELFGRSTGDEAPSESQNEPLPPSDAGVLGFASRIFRIGYAGRGRGAPGT
jgi:hypothetical protein